MSYVDAFSELETDGLAEGDQPWCDLAFDMVSFELGKKPLFGKEKYMAKGEAIASTPRGDIGFAFELEPLSHWKLDQQEGVTFTWGKVELRSTGARTDRLLREYETWFHTSGSESAAEDKIGCLAVVLGDDLSKAAQQKLNMKLFFDPSTLGLDQEEHVDLYGELFFNIDAPNKRVQLREKAPEYRNQIVGWLSGKIQAGARR